MSVSSDHREAELLGKARPLVYACIREDSHIEDSAELKSIAWDLGRNGWDKLHSLRQHLIEATRGQVYRAYCAGVRAAKRLDLASMNVSRTKEGGLRLTVLAIAHAAIEQQTGNPLLTNRQASVQTEGRLGRMTFDRAVHQLEELGLLEVRRRGPGKASAYRLTPPGELTHLYPGRDEALKRLQQAIASIREPKPGMVEKAQAEIDKRTVSKSSYTAERIEGKEKAVLKSRQDRREWAQKEFDMREELSKPRLIRPIPGTRRIPLVTIEPKESESFLEEEIFDQFIEDLVRA